MSHRPLTSRIQELFQSRPDPHFDSIEDGFRSGRLRLPAQPMTDQELARAIQEVRGARVSDWTLRQLANRFEKN